MKKTKEEIEKEIELISSMYCAGSPLYLNI